MTDRIAHHQQLRGKIVALLTMVALVACADLNDSGHWFPEARRYQGECLPPQEDEGGCWWFAFTPAGRVDFTSGGDIAYIGEYRIKGDRVRVTAAQHSDLDLRLSAEQDTLWLPQGSYILRTK